VGTRLEVLIRERPVAIEVLPRPMYKRPKVTRNT
jgi:hypothetical protein